MLCSKKLLDKMNHLVQQKFLIQKNFMCNKVWGAEKFFVSKHGLSHEKFWLKNILSKKMCKEKSSPGQMFNGQISLLEL